MTPDRSLRPHPEIIEVEPARFARAVWDSATQTSSDEGDIVRSYSADRIGMAGRVRRPFAYLGERWVCTGMSVNPAQCEAYRLVAIEGFSRTVQSYAEKTLDAEAARNDPFGFYDGMHVTSGAHKLVLCGPPVCFVAGREAQLGLFDEGSAQIARPTLDDRGR